MEIDPIEKGDPKPLSGFTIAAFLLAYNAAAILTYFALVSLTGFERDQQRPVSIGLALLSIIIVGIVGNIGAKMWNRHRARKAMVV